MSRVFSDKQLKDMGFTEEETAELNKNEEAFAESQVPVPPEIAQLISDNIMDLF